ncbi:MAG: hypothetical protein KAJ33_08520, partial [Thermoplasmata archaeon]|nr:hypothetical protein [Thermoplasmata archaeon]
YATSPDGVSWTKQGLVMDYGEPNETDGVRFPSVIKLDNKYHMWYSGVSGTGVLKILYASSSDGIAWNKHGLALDIAEVPGEANSVSESCFFVDSGRLMMWYTGTTWAPSKGRILYAETPIFGPLSWDKQGVALPLGINPDPDYSLMGTPYIMKNGTQYMMWYIGGGSTVNYEIFHATSNDGYSWTKKGIVLNLGTSGQTDDYRLAYPRVIYDEGQYKMWYSGSDGTNYRVHYATSPDGETWTKEGVVMDLGAPGELDDEHVLCTSIMKLSNGTYQMWITGSDGTNFRIFAATSLDGIAWTKNGVVVDLGAPGDMDDVHALYPTVCVISNQYSMWYRGNSGTEAILYASSPDGETWTKHGMAIPIGTSGDTDDNYITDPSVLLDNDGYAKLWYAGHDGSNYRIHLAVTPTIRESSGQIISEQINLQAGATWESVNLTKDEPGTDNNIPLTVLDGGSGTPIAGYIDLTGPNIDITGIDGVTYPSIQLQADFTGNGSATPILHDWWVNWTTDGAVVDSTPPEITDLTTGTPETGQDFTITVLVTDDNLTSEVCLNYQLENPDWTSDWTNSSMTDIGGDNYNFDVPILENSTLFRYFICASDNSSNWNSTSLVGLAVNDTIVPEIEDITSGTPVTGDSFDILINITDNIEVDYARIYVYYDLVGGNSTPQNIQLTSVSGDTYHVNVSIPLNATTLFYSAMANDTSNNWNLTDVISHDVHDDQAPTASYPSYALVNMGSPFTFNGSSSTDNIGIVNYSWIFTF